MAKLRVGDVLLSRYDKPDDELHGQPVFERVDGAPMTLEDEIKMKADLVALRDLLAAYMPEVFCG
jgi:hypothetical protein